MAGEPMTLASIARQDELHRLWRDHVGIRPRYAGRGASASSKVKILDSEPDFFARGVKEAVYIRANRPTLNRDGGRHRLYDTYDPLLLSRVSDVTSRKLQ
ncbi:hypothetical protein Bbelb_030070 [Branchiostoma belcheri]|nr:hypothetical protein Bbelb_030070 [Branchiostoma belcheri]